MAKVTGGVSTKTIYEVNYSFPHMLTERQQAQTELAPLAVQIQQSNANYQYVRARFIEGVNPITMKTEKAIMVRMESTAEPNIEDKRQIAKVMERYMQDCLGADQVSRASSYQVYYEDTPLTVPIADPGRANLAYSMLAVMAETDVQANIRGERISLDAYGLSIRDENGKPVEAELDREWFGTDEENRQCKEAALEKQIQAGIESGMLDSGRQSRKFEEALQEPYSVCSYDENRNVVSFAPETWDIDKAADMQNFMVYGLHPDVTLCVEQDGKLVGIQGNICIINSDHDVLCDQLNKAWAHEDGKADFAAAVEQLSEDDGLTR